MWVWTPVPALFSQTFSQVCHLSFVVLVNVCAHMQECVCVCPNKRLGYYSEILHKIYCLSGSKNSAPMMLRGSIVEQNENPSTSSFESGWLQLIKSQTIHSRAGRPNQKAAMLNVNLWVKEKIAGRNTTDFYENKIYLVTSSVSLTNI